jgi:AcrR family transcriptional regulator
MKVSEEEKAKTRLRLLEAAVDVITQKGFRAASMREIAKRAGVGDATIYNYFPSKEKLIYGYCEEVQRKVMAELRAIEQFHEYTLGEQLQQLIEVELQIWLPAREFLQQIFRHTLSSPMSAYEQLAAARDLNMRMVVDLLDAAIEAEEIPEQPYRELLPRLFWDYQSGIIAYWLRDDSEGFAHTTELVDRSMEVLVGVLQLGLVGKTLNLISFVFRTHVMSHLERFGDLKGTLHKTKRRFMEGADNESGS